MKKTILIIILALSLNANCQIISDFKTDSDGNINYNDVIELKDKTKDQLFLKAKSYFVDTFKSANDVIQLEDKENSIIVGRGNSTIHVNAGMGVSSTMLFNYRIKIETKDNKIRYELYNLTFSNAYGSAGMENWFDTKMYYKSNGKPRKINLQVKEQVLNDIDKIILSINDYFIKEKALKSDW